MANNVVELIVDLKVEGKKDLAKYSRELKQLSKIMTDLDKQNKKQITTSKQLQTQNKKANKETTNQVNSNKKLVSSQKALIANNSKIVNSTKSQVAAQKELAKILKDVAKESEGLGNTGSSIGDSFGKSGSKIGKFSKVAGATVSVLKGLAVAAFSVGSAISTMVLNSAKSVRELENLSRQAKLSKLDFEALAFATNQFGITQEQIADISKDLYDKLGDSVTNAAGPFHEFGNALSLTKEETRDLAREFQNLSSPQIIGEMVNRLDAAGVSSAQMTQVMEAMGNDLSRLYPLFKNNSKELEKLDKQYKKINESLQLTDEQTKNLLDAAVRFDLFSKSVSNSSNVISSELSPAINTLFEELTKTIPVITQQLAKMIHSFREIENMTNFNTLNDEFKDSNEELNELNKKLVKQQELLEKQKSGKAGNSNYNNYNTTQIKIYETEQLIFEENKKNEEIQNRIKELRQQEIKDNQEIIKQEKEKKAAAENGNTGNKGTAGDVVDLNALKDRFKTEEQLAKEQYEKDLKLAGDNSVLKLKLLEEYSKKYVDLMNQRYEAEATLQNKLVNDQIKSIENQKAILKLDLELGNVSSTEFENKIKELGDQQIKEIEKTNLSDLEKKKEILLVNKEISDLTKKEVDYKIQSFDLSNNQLESDKKIEEYSRKIAESKQNIKDLTSEATDSTKELAKLEKQRLDAEEKSLERMLSLRSQLLELDSTKNDVDILENERTNAISDINSREGLSDESKQKEIDLTNLLFDEQKIDAEFEMFMQKYQEMLRQLQDANPEEAGNITSNITDLLQSAGSMEGLDAEQLNQITNATLAWNESLEGVGVTLNDVANQLSDGMVDAIGSVIDGSKSIDEAFADMALSIIQNLIEVQLQMMIMKALGISQGGSGGGGGFTGDGLFGMIGGLFSGGSMPFFHNGGDVDSPMVDTRPARSPNSDEMLAMVKKNETIMTKNQKNDLQANGGNTKVNVNNNLVLDPADLQKSIGKTDEFNQDIISTISANSQQIKDILS